MKLAHSEIAQFCRNLALLLHAGISLADGIFLICQEQTGPVAELLRDLGKQLDEGLTLGEAMERSGAFPRCAAGMVSIGEQTGRTEEVLELLSMGIAASINISDASYAMMVGSYVNQMTPPQQEYLTKAIRSKVTGQHLRHLELHFSSQTKELALSGMCAYVFDRHFSID